MPAFSQHLFWDVNRESVDPMSHAPWLVQRVLEYGKWSDFRLLVTLLGKKEVGSIATTLRCLEPRALQFCSVFFEIPLSEFRCSTPIASQLPS